MRGREDAEPDALDVTDLGHGPGRNTSPDPGRNTSPDPGRPSSAGPVPPPPFARQPAVVASVGLLAVIAVLTGLVLHNPAVAPSLRHAPSMRHAAATTSSPATPPVPDDRRVVAGLGTTPVTDLVAGSHAVYALQPAVRRIARIDPAGGSVSGYVPVPAGVTGMAVDPGLDALWLFSRDGTDATVRFYPLSSTGGFGPTPAATTTVGGRVLHAVALGGQLWLARWPNTLAIGVQPGPRLVTRIVPVGQAQSLTADRQHDRVLMVTRGPTGATLWSAGAGWYRGGTRSGGARTGGAGLRRVAAIPLRSISVAVVRDAVWLAGRTATGPAGVQVDVSTGAVTLVPPGPGVLSIAGTLSAGTDVLWWRVGDVLDCLDPTLASILHLWALPGIEDGLVVSAGPHAYTVNDGEVSVLTTGSGCPG